MMERLFPLLLTLALRFGGTPILGASARQDRVITRLGPQGSGENGGNPFGKVEHARRTSQSRYSRYRHSGVQVYTSNRHHTDTSVQGEHNALLCGFATARHHSRVAVLNAHGTLYLDFLRSVPSG
jgi:hypothetical protein